MQLQPGRLNDLRFQSDVIDEARRRIIAYVLQPRQANAAATT